MAESSVERWREELQRARADADRVRSELQRWELLGSQKGGTGDRGKQGTAIRDALGQLRTTLERLDGDLTAMRGAPAASEATRKALAPCGDELAQVQAQLQEMQQRARGAPSSAAGRPGAPGPGGPPPAGAAPAGSFRRLPGGAEMQPVSMSSRQRMEQNDQIIRSFDEPLDQIGQSVNRLQEVSGVIHREITSQNQMLARLNTDAEGAMSRLERVKRMLDRLHLRDRNRCFFCTILCMLAALVAIFVMVVTS